MIADMQKLRILNLYSSESLVSNLLRVDLPMYHLTSVMYLNLMSSNIQALSPTFPQYLPNIKRIQLSGNPWSCDRWASVEFVSLSSGLHRARALVMLQNSHMIALTAICSHLLEVFKDLLQGFPLEIHRNLFGSRKFVFLLQCDSFVAMTTHATNPNVAPHGPKSTFLRDIS